MTPDKTDLSCFIEVFPLAMQAIARTHEYNRGPLMKGNYLPSLLRHLFKIGAHPDHDAAVAWNAIAQLEIKLRETGCEVNGYKTQEERRYE